MVVATAVRAVLGRREQARRWRLVPGRAAGGSGSSNFRKELASLAIGSGKVKSVKGSTLTVSGYDRESRPVHPGNDQVQLEDQEAHHAQDGDPHHHDVEVDDGELDAECGGLGAGRR